MGYQAKLLSGLGWIGAFRGAAKVIVFAKIILAYRFLTPREVGLYGLALIVLGLLEMMTETGVNVIIVKEKRPLSYYLDTAFIVSIGRGVLIALCIAASAFFLPSFFHDQGLFPLLLLVALIPLVRGFINPAVAQYQKDLKFSKDALYKLINISTDVVFSALLLFLFRSAASVILGMLVSAIAEVIISFLFIKPRPKLGFKKEVYSAIVTPGKWVNLAGVITFAEQNFDNVIVGRMLDSTALGYYQTAFNLARSFVTEIGMTFSQVLLPIYGRIGGQEDRLKRAVKKIFLPAAIMMLIPIIALNYKPVQEIMLVFLKDKWRPMLPLLPYLSIGAWFTGMNTVFNPLFLVRNRYRSMVALYGSNLIFLVVMIVLLIPMEGLVGAAKAVLISRVVLQPFFIWRARIALRKG